LGGRDPYSASKAAAELIIASYRHSFFRAHPVKIASARAGNVIGGGDWSADRIVPDSIRALRQDQPIPVRNPRSTRPWQHVLEALSGYLWLAALLSKPALGKSPPSRLAGAFNFGPDRESNRTVEQLVVEILKHWPGKWENKAEPGAVHEAGFLQLSTDKARAILGWSPVWDFPDTIEKTAVWYQKTREGKDASFFRSITAGQIMEYTGAAEKKELPWTRAGKRG
jgi:CDP-glucose 4,6-dehydratase